MRKTTFPSRFVGSVLVAALFAGPLEGQQDSLPPADPMVLPAGSLHVVLEGETLWGLASRYYGDPYLWPEIYRLNTLTVEDPHWIFPGERLILVARAAEPVVEDPPPDTVAVVDFDPNVSEFDQGGPPAIPRSRLFVPTAGQGQNLALGDTGPDLYRPVRKQEFHSAGFLTEGENLPLGEVLGAVGTNRSNPIATASSTTLNRRLQVDAPRSALYQVGDTLVTVALRRRVSQWGRIVVPTGLVVVENVSGRRAIARVVMQYELILDRQYAMPIEPFRDPGPVRPEPVEPSLRGEIIAIRDQHPVPLQQDVVFIDLGRSDGVTPGDRYDVVAEAEVDAFSDVPLERVASLRIVHVRENSATGIITQIYRSGLARGSKVVVTHKMPT